MTLVALGDPLPAPDNDGAGADHHAPEIHDAVNVYVLAARPCAFLDQVAVAAYRTSVEEGKPLSERKLAAMFGKTSHRWARHRMAEAMAQVTG